MFDKLSDIIVFAHNFGVFDGHFILKKIYKHGGYGRPKILMNGAILEIGKIRFIDSLNYFARPLSKENSQKSLAFLKPKGITLIYLIRKKTLVA